MARYWMSLPDWMNALTVTMLPKPPGSGARLKGLGIVISIAIATAAIFALTHTLKNVDYNEVFEVVRHTKAGLIAKRGRLCAGPIGNLRRLPLLRAVLIRPLEGERLARWLDGRRSLSLLYFPPASSHAAISARSSPVISVTLPGGIALDHAALRPIRRAARRI